jgi:hypothetical protein
MDVSPPPRTGAYLLQNRANSFFTTATLELTESTVRCAVQQYSRWVQEVLGITDLKQRLQSGEPVVAFEVNRAEVKVKWLRQFMGGGFQISSGDSRTWAGLTDLPEWPLERLGRHNRARRP